MKTDQNGCSTCPIGQEQYESFNTPKGIKIQYDYRHTDGELFSCVAGSLGQAREKKDVWLHSKKVRNDKKI